MKRSLHLAVLGIDHGHIFDMLDEDLETLPRNPDVALDALERAKALHPVLGEDFVKLFVEVKRAEAEAFLEVISPWEREYLLLNV